MRTGHVYALVDVRRPYDYRYVGKTVQSLRRRLARHRATMLTMPHLHVMRWMAKIRPWNVRIVSLGEYPVDELRGRESQWMAILREAGHELTNIAPGGSGSGFPRGYYQHSEETKRLIQQRRSVSRAKPWLGKTRDPATRAKISESLRKRRRDV